LLSRISNPLRAAAARCGATMRIIDSVSVEPRHVHRNAINAPNVSSLL
jgi:hypothetical protein